MKRRNSFDSFQIAAAVAPQVPGWDPAAAAPNVSAEPSAPKVPGWDPAASPSAEPSAETPAETPAEIPGPTLDHSTSSHRVSYRLSSNTQAHSVSLLQDIIDSTIDRSRIFYHINFQLFIHFDNEQQNADYYRSFFVIAKDYIYGPNGWTIGHCDMIALNPINGCRSIQDRSLMINVVRSPVDLTLSFQTVGQGTLSIGGSVTISKMSI